MSISDALDQLTALKQAKCDHVQQNKITVNNKVYCGDCAKEMSN